ncbi:MAG: hypothetical protein Q9187_003797 [Circinaria calcarea]
MSISIGDGSISSFSQQGTIDWVQLGNTGVTATVAILSRISAAHIDPFTLTVAQAVAGQYKLSCKGKARLNECLQSLKCFASFENVLWFGFGIKHVIRILARTTQGMSTIALCGSLSEVMSSEMVASILDELPAIYGAPLELRPSLLQWEALVTNCSGVISSTNFGLVAEYFMGLSGDGPVAPHPFHIKNPRTQSRDCGQPKDVATALHAIGKLSSGSLIAIELRGGAVCGLLGALGFWFLGLEVEIRKGSIVAYRSVSDEEPVQILVTYGAVNDQASSIDMQVASRSYHICNISSILEGRLIDYDHDNHIISGRVPWDKAIQTTFGSVGEELLKAHYHFSQILGNAARIFTALANSEPNNLGIEKPKSYYRHCAFKTVVVHNDNSHGKGFIHFMMARLPELATLDRHLMETCLDYPLAKAHEQFEAAMRRMVMLCDCIMCNEPEDSNDFERYKTFCIPLLAEFIVATLRNLALVHPDTDLKPYRSGLEKLYRSYEFSIEKPKHRIDGVIDHLTMVSVYDTAELIYTGRQEMMESWQEAPLKSAKVPPVFSAHGMTFYLDILRELSDRPGAAAILHVVPGNMVLESGRIYTIARDSPPAGCVKYQATNCKLSSSLPSPADTSNSELIGKLAVKESMRALSIEFCFTRSGMPLCSIGPADLVDRLARVSFSVHCPRRRCPDIKAPLTSIFTVDGEGKVDPEADVDSGRLVVIRRLQGNLIARCISLCQNAKYATISRDITVHDKLDVATQERKDILYHENVLSIICTSLFTADVHTGMGRHAQFLGEKRLGSTVRLNFIANPFGIMAYSFPNISVAIVLVRIVAPNRYFRWTIHAIAIAQAYSAFTDIFLAVVPAVMFWKLQLKSKTKVGLCILMGMTALAAICAIVKTTKLNELADLTDFTYGTVDLVIWAIVEANVIIIAACIPTLRPFVVSVQKGVQGSEGRLLFGRLRGFRSYGYGRSTRDTDEFTGRYKQSGKNSDPANSGTYPLAAATRTKASSENGSRRHLTTDPPSYPKIKQTTEIATEWETV